MYLFLILNLKCCLYLKLCNLFLLQVRQIVLLFLQTFFFSYVSSPVIKYRFSINISFCYLIGSANLQLCAWHIANAIASVVSSSFGIFVKFKILCTIICTCFFSARPYPTTACFTCKGVYSYIGVLVLAAAIKTAPLPCATPIAVVVFVLKIILLLK